MPNAIDLTGKRFGRLSVTRRDGSKTYPSGKTSTAWLCVCDCGNSHRTTKGALMSGSSKSCGCFQREDLSARRRARALGLSNTKVYHAWVGMISRTSDIRDIGWRNYGGRGITVCEKWKSFLEFYNDMGEPPTSRHSLGRKDNEKGYFKDNCRWETQKEQTRNTRRNVILTVNGESKCAQDWSAVSGVKAGLIRARVKAGWNHSKAIYQKSQK